MPWPVQDYRRTDSHFPSGPRHGLWHYYKKLFIIPYQQQTFFYFLGETLLRWHLNLFQFSFVNKSMINLFVSIKPKIQKFTFLIEKVTFQEKQYKICIFFNKIGTSLGRPKKSIIYNFFWLHKIINDKCFFTWKICISRKYYKFFKTKFCEIRGIEQYFARGRDHCSSSLDRPKPKKGIISSSYNAPDGRRDLKNFNFSKNSRCWNSKLFIRTKFHSHFRL